MTQETAVAVLKGMSLAAEILEIDSEMPGGTVDHQDPASASEVLPDTTVKLFVSNAPPAKTVIVPAVAALELTEAEAKAILVKYRLKAEIIDLEIPDVKPGLCIYQDPAAGAEAQDQQRREDHHRAQAGRTPRPPRRRHRRAPPGTTRRTHAS